MGLMKLDWLGLSCHLQICWLHVFAVDFNCQLLRKDISIPQHVLFVLNMQCAGFLYIRVYKCTHAAPLLFQSRAARTYISHDSQRQLRVCSFFKVCEQGRVSVCAYRAKRYSFPDHGLQVMYCWTKVAVYCTTDRFCSSS